MPPCIDLEALFAETRPTEVVVECRPNGDLPDYMREGRLDVNDLPLGVIELKNPAEGHRLDGPDSSFRPTKRSSRRC